ncbi:NAD(P)-binding domain-containing protein [Gluconacetobacter tumulicola]|uniref:NAD(P)/FAD-dependent oxidoreductase n=1 Tax=Gluconacetobacter tumulicola TaxID=1017177 RepID=A0A7W4PA00_9PROT|nr:NAD(P)/FAD-dependent oxidoreductase [Gluconacetobacter tumulicola]MBB2181033.1 NAD(P)/FAD-dependent oxidoreductase [Gluconacetobacter tumulicola]
MTYPIVDPEADRHVVLCDPPEIAGGLSRLDARVRQDLAWLDLPAENWVPGRVSDGQQVRDVVVIGGGMAGLAVSGTLMRYGVRNHVVYDREGVGAEGPWLGYARMRTLRSPKSLPGPCLGVPSLTFRAWYEARFGDEAWAALVRIPRATWMEYLVWLRRVLDLPVRNDSELTAVAARDDGLLALTMRHAGHEERVLCRHLVLATGRDGLGGAYVPPAIAALPRGLYAHSSDRIDFAALRGRRVAVVGGGASAMDNAATALEAGAARVDLLIRRKDLPRVNKFTGIGSPGVVQGFVGLPDGWKWRFLDYTLGAQTPPPRPSTLRVSRHDNAYFHLGCALQSVAEQDGALRIATSRGVLDTDFLIAATGFVTDMTRRPEFAAFADKVRRWGDRFRPDAADMPSGRINAELAGAPDLGPGFAFQEREEGCAPYLRQIHCFCFPATLSHGKVSGDIPAISDGADRLARHLAQSLFVADRAIHYRNLQDFATPELLGDEWRDTPLPQPA